MINFKNKLITGTAILISIGCLNKFISFLFKIFLSNVLGSENLGIYQLVFPIQGLCFCFCSAGIQTAISQLVAPKNKTNKIHILLSGMFVSFCISTLALVILFIFSPQIARYITQEPKCTYSIKILALSIPLSSVHSCICGYYFGKQNAKIPALSQIFEQIIRVFVTFIIYFIVSQGSNQFLAHHAVIGIIAGEFAAVLYCFCNIKSKLSISNSLTHVKLIVKQSIPLTSSKLIPGIFQSIETIILPSQLALSGMSMSNSLKIYGIMTGMALPIIMFPSTITNSMAVLLLPAISKAKSEENTKLIIKTTFSSVLLSILLGLFFSLIFIFGGEIIGKILFNNIYAGNLISKLSFICPFIYVNITMTSILNGLGHINQTFIYNIISISIRIIITLLAVPVYGIDSYIYSILVSQAILFILHLYSIVKTICTFLTVSQSTQHHQNN